MASDVAGIGHRVHYWRLHASHVGHEATGCGSQRLGHCVGEVADRGGHESHLGIGVPPDPIHHPHVQGGGQGVFIEVDTGDVPSSCPQRHANRTTNEASADDCRPTRRTNRGSGKHHGGRCYWGPSRP